MPKETAMRRIVAMGIVLMGCQGPADADDPCGAARFAALVGTPIAEASLPPGSDVRIIGPGDAVTFDYVETRVNLRTDARGIVTSVSCG
jgi:hypothetical protein